MQQFTTGDSGWIEKQVLSWRRFLGYRTILRCPATLCAAKSQNQAACSVGALRLWISQADQIDQNWQWLEDLEDLDWVFPATRTSIAQSKDNCREFQGKFQHRLPSSMLANFLESMQASQPGLICFLPQAKKAEPAGRADARFNTVRSKTMSFQKMTNEQSTVR